MIGYDDDGNELTPSRKAMNKRIQELYELATDSADIVIKGATIPDLHKWHDIRMQKFAELIVQECASICITRNVSNLDIETVQDSGKFTVQDLATKSCGDNLAQIIKDHFGV